MRMTTTPSLHAQHDPRQSSRIVPGSTFDDKVEDATVTRIVNGIAVADSLGRIANADDKDMNKSDLQGPNPNGTDSWAIFKLKW